MSNVKMGSLMTRYELYVADLIGLLEQMESVTDQNRLAIQNTCEDYLDHFLEVLKELPNHIGPKALNSIISNAAGKDYQWEDGDAPSKESA